MAMLALGIVLSFVLGPFAWQLVTALKPEGQLAKLPPLWPEPVTWEHFAAVLNAPGFLRVCGNSLLTAGGTVLVALGLGLPAAYALAKLHLRASQRILTLLLCLSMFPPIANVAPLYLLFVRVGIRDSILGVIVTHSVFTLPFAIWILTSFLQEVPDDLYRAARVDGCSHLGILRHVVMPLAAPGLASVGLLVFIFSWNEFLYAFTLTASERSRTLPVAIALFPGLHEIPWGDIAAAAVLATLPTVALVLLFQKRIVSGLTAGSVKF
ncbi:MAG: carbohydrate ABC transporter permease [Acidobacteria bacterium]|nr:carbohydrate ABC transporter permease [Acidobacteriota bacterium]